MAALTGCGLAPAGPNPNSTQQAPTEVTKSVATQSVAPNTTTASTTAQTTDIVTSQTPKNTTRPSTTSSEAGSVFGECLIDTYNNLRASRVDGSTQLSLKSVGGSPATPWKDWNCGDRPDRDEYCCPMNADFNLGIELGSELREHDYVIGQDGVSATYRFLFEHPGPTETKGICECSLVASRKMVPVTSGVIQIRYLPGQRKEFGVRVRFPEIAPVPLTRIGRGIPVN